METKWKSSSLYLFLLFVPLSLLPYRIKLKYHASFVHIINVTGMIVMFIIIMHHLTTSSPLSSYWTPYPSWPTFFTQNCWQKEAMLRPENNQIIYLTLMHYWSGCTLNTSVPDVPFYHCAATRTFRSSRERWWYIATSHCGSLKVTTIHRRAEFFVCFLMWTNRVYYLKLLIFLFI